MPTHAYPTTAAILTLLAALNLFGCGKIEQAHANGKPAPGKPAVERPIRPPQARPTKWRPGDVRRPRGTIRLIEALRKPPLGRPEYEVAVYRSPSGVVVLPYEDVKGLAVAEGDIILGPTAEVRARQAALLTSIDGAAFALASPGTPELGQRWPNGIIRFKKHHDLADDRVDAIDFAISEYERLTPLRFDEIEGDSGNFVEFVNQWPFLSSMSALGMRGGRQEIKISTADLQGVVLERAALHELGHTVGFKHEHSRPDRDEFVTIDFDCTSFWYDITGNWSIASDYDPIGPYDFLSVMHYSTKRACIDGTGCCEMVKRPEHRDDNDPIGVVPFNTRLSPRDINAIYLMYSESPARNEGGDWFGASVLVHDFDGDGIDDVAVGAPREETSGNRRGAVYLYKGTETRLAYWKRFLAPAPEGNESFFGFALAAGDFNEDGIQDLAIGAPRADTGDQAATGAVFVYSVLGNANHELIATLHKDDRDGESREAFDQFGASLAAYNAPAGPRLAIGAPGGRSALRRTGAVYIATIDDDPDLERVATQGHYIANFRSFGYALTAARQPGATADMLLASAPTQTMDDDLSRGTPSVFSIGVRQSDGRYAIFDRIYSPDVEPNTSAFVTEPGVALDVWASVVEPDFGSALAAGDFDDDGRLDLAVGSTLSGGAGRVFLYERDALSWIPQQTLDQTGLDANEDMDTFGGALAARDVDGDGHDDLIVGASTENQGDVWNAGAVYMFRGASGSDLVEPWQSLHPTVDGFPEFEDCFAYRESDWFGRAVSVGDVNGDGELDVIVGGPQRAPCEPQVQGFGIELAHDQASGEVYLFTGDDLGAMAVLHQETQSPHLD